MLLLCFCLAVCGHLAVLSAPIYSGSWWPPFCGHPKSPQRNCIPFCWPPGFSLGLDLSCCPCGHLDCLWALIWSIKDSCPHHKPRKLIASSSKDERCRDRALKKIYDKASSHLSSSPRAKEGICPSGTEFPIERSPAVTPDQMSP